MNARETIQRALENASTHCITSSFQAECVVLTDMVREFVLCLTPTELPEPQAPEVMELVDKLEQDEDVQKVYHTLA